METKSSYEPGTIYCIKMATFGAIDPWGHEYEIPCYSIEEFLEIQSTDELHEWVEPYTQEKQYAIIYSTKDGRGFWPRPPTDYSGHTVWVEIEPAGKNHGYWVAESALPVKVTLGGVPWYTERTIEQIRHANERLRAKSRDRENR